jgi:Flp pilus assembly protein TadG
MMGVRRLPARQGASRRGAAAIELALVAPWLVLLMLVCIDFGRYPTTVIAVRNAARVGAGFASSNSYPSTELLQARWKALLRQAVEDEMSGLGGFKTELMTPHHVTVRTDSEGVLQVLVEVGYPFQTLVDLNPLGVVLPHRIDVSQEVVMDLPPDIAPPPEMDF